MIEANFNNNSKNPPVKRRYIKSRISFSGINEAKKLQQLLHNRNKFLIHWRSQEKQQSNYSLEESVAFLIFTNFTTEKYDTLRSI